MMPVPQLWPPRWRHLQLSPRGRFTPYILGVGLLALAAVTLLFALYALFLDETPRGFVMTAAAATGLGGVLLWIGQSSAEPTRREALIGVLLLWLAIPAFGALPFAVSGGMNPLNALFESMSGFTTTGATVLRDFSSFGESLFMWRAFIQWVGGVGIIVLFIAVFPQLALAGRQLFFSETPGPTEDRLTPRLRNTANAVLLVYVGLTVACTAAYVAAGLPVAEAVAHAFTTLAAGGFSSSPTSFEGFDNPALEWVAIIFMTFAGANFALQYRALMGRPRELTRDPELRAYLLIILVAGALVTLALWNSYEGLLALRHAFFQVISILTTTGYASADFALWPQRAQVLLIMLMFVGGSAGSAAGGIKVVRWLIISQSTAQEVRRALHPRAVLPVRVGNRAIPDEVMRAVAGFITLYVGLFAVSTAVLAWFEADFVTAFTAAIACLGNIGPGLEAVGPMLSFAELHPVSRALLTFNMYAGRLEIVIVFIVFNADFWRVPRAGSWRS
jgi:trk system potassium uptake protein